MFLKNLLTTQTKNIGFASVILAFFYMCSAALGLLRDHLLAGKFGADNELDVYYAAFTIPDLIALLLVFGAVSAAIIPIFSGYLVRRQEEAWEYASNLLNIFLVCLVVICGVLMIFAPWLVKLTVPGFSPEKQAACATLMRIMFLSPIILGMSTIMSGILQVFHRFLVTALAPVMYNLGIIFGIIFFVPVFDLTGLAFGVVLGGLLHAGIQIPVFIFSGFKYRPLFNFRHPGVMQTLKLMVPRSLGLGAGQLNAIATTAIASTLATGSVAVYSLASNMPNLLVTAIGASLSAAIFPSLSVAYLQESKTDFERKFSGAFLQLVFLSIPASVLVFLLRAQITRVIWGSGRFGWEDTRLTAACLGIFALGLCFQGLIFLLSKTFYAAHNTKIPAIVSGATVVLNIALSLFFVWLLNMQGAFYGIMQSWLRLQGIDNISVTGLALAFSITGLVEAMLLLWLLYKNYQTFRLSHFWQSGWKMVASVIALALVTLVVRQELVYFNIVQLETFLGVFLQLAISGTAGVVTYLGAAFFLKSPELERVRGLIFKR